MKQGHASHSGTGATKVEPKSQGISPGAVSRLGTMVGDHSMDGDCHSANHIPIYQGRGLKAPMVGQTNHHCGSQGKHK